jgi:uncharacterized protein (DUF2252 family)
VEEKENRSLFKRGKAAIELPPLPPLSERRNNGKSLRERVARASHADWSPATGRPDPLELLMAQDANREQDLVPIRYGRMMVSPFTFFRGSATVMANDLSNTPTSGLIVQACGDAHLSNFGTFATPERNQVFDINDFDETLPAPWEWDMKRLAASIVVAGRDNGFKPRDCNHAAASAVRSYRERVAEFATMGHLELWYARIGREDIEAVLPKKSARQFDRGMNKATKRDHLQALSKLTAGQGNEMRVVDDPPLIVHVSDPELEERLRSIAITYRSSIRSDLQALLNRYIFADTARKVVGVGSVGTRCHVILFRGNNDQDPLILQIKEAFASVLEPYTRKSAYTNHGKRVVVGQQQIQAASDIFLGWGRSAGSDFYVRQLRDMKGSVEVALLSPKDLTAYAGLCGWALARAHARSGDAASIAGYLGNSDEFDRATVTFANTYADQTERDHAALVEAVKSGRIVAEQDR